MNPDLQAIVTILGMAAVTYATRASGLWLMRRVTPSPGVSAWLRHIPGTILIALVAPLVLSGGITTCIAGGTTVLVMLRTRQVMVAAAAGVVVVWLMRTWSG